MIPNVSPYDSRSSITFLSIDEIVALENFCKRMNMEFWPDLREHGYFVDSKYPFVGILIPSQIVASRIFSELSRFLSLEYPKLLDLSKKMRSADLAFHPLPDGKIVALFKNVAGKDYFLKEIERILM